MMLPQQRNEAEIERAISYTRKVLNAAENSNQAGEDLIVVMSSAADLYEALMGIVADDDASVSLDDQRARWDARMAAAKAAILKVTGAKQ